MAGFTDLVAQAQPALYGKGVTASATAGATWLWSFVEVTDSAGDPINLSAVTGVCEVVNIDTDAVVTTITFTGAADGSFTLSKDESLTAAVAVGKYRWRLSLNNATDTVQAWGGNLSKFTVEEA